MEKFDLTTMISQVDLFSFIVWKNLKTKKDISKLIDLYLVQTQSHKHK